LGQSNMEKDRLSRKKSRVRSKFTKEGYRLSLYRSNRYLFAQIIDSKSGKTILGLAEKKTLAEKEIGSKTKTEKAKLFGVKFAKEAVSKKINKFDSGEIRKIVFDRGLYRYHGRVKAFAEGARKGGLEF